MSNNNNNTVVKHVNTEVFDDSQNQEYNKKENSYSACQNYDMKKEEKNETESTYHDREEKNKQEESVKTPTNSKYEWKRTKNLEEAYPFICNLFFFFYFPYICRIKPIREEDIPVIAEEDKSELNTKKLKDHWDSLLVQYLKDLKEYEEKLKENPEFVSFLKKF